MNVQFPKALTKALVLFQRQRLIPEEEHAVIHPGLVQLVELLVANFTAEVDAAHDGTDVRTQGAHLYRFVGHGGNVS